VGYLATTLYMTESYVHTEQRHCHAYYGPVCAPPNHVAKSHACMVCDIFREPCFHNASFWENTLARSSSTLGRMILTL